MMRSQFRAPCLGQVVGTVIQFRKILVPLDFSEPSKRALDYGLAFATRMKAKLVVAHIIPEASTLEYAVCRHLVIERDLHGEVGDTDRVGIPDAAH
jgi:nucleotide-binding universal stress UspA family protein